MLNFELIKFQQSQSRDGVLVKFQQSQSRDGVLVKFQQSQSRDGVLVKFQQSQSRDGVLLKFQQSQSRDGVLEHDLSRSFELSHQCEQYKWLRSRFKSKLQHKHIRVERVLKNTY